MKKLLAIALSLVLVLSLVACTTGGGGSETKISKENIKIGFVHVSDPSDMGYTYNHDLGTQKMMADLGLKEDQVINKFNVAEDAACDAAIRELVEAGCNVIFATSFGFEDYMIAVAKEYPDIQFCHATGYKALSTELPNFQNYFGSIYQARYLSGIVAGEKLKADGKTTLGYVCAMPFAECISGYCAFYLGAKSVVPEATMKVMYTNAWNDPTKEAQVAQALIDAGAYVLGQHCDSTAPATTAEKNKVFHVGYNSNMIGAAPNASLTSAVWDWSKYLIFAVNCVLNGEDIPTDWSQGLKEGVCMISDLNEAIVPSTAAAAVEAAKQKIISGEWDVFTGPLHGAGVDFDGNPVEKTLADGERFVEPQSAPSWNFIVDGIEIIE